MNNDRFALEVSCYWASQNERFCSLSIIQIVIKLAVLSLFKQGT
jgi:hypothetical protein